MFRNLEQLYRSNIIVAHLDKFSLHFFKFVVCNYPWISVRIFSMSTSFQDQGKGPGNEIVSMFVPLWCIIISLVFFYFSLLLFTGFLQLQGYVVSVQKAQSTVIALLRWSLWKFGFKTFFLPQENCLNSQRCNTEQINLPEISVLYVNLRSRQIASALIPVRITP